MTKEQKTKKVGGITVPVPRESPALKSSHDTTILSYKEGEFGPLTWARELLHHPKLPPFIKGVEDVASVLTAVKDIKGPAGLFATAALLWGKSKSYIDPVPSPPPRDWLEEKGWYSIKSSLLKLLCESGLFDQFPSVDISDVIDPDPKNDIEWVEVNLGFGDVLLRKVNGLYEFTAIRNNLDEEMDVRDFAMRAVKTCIPGGSVEAVISRDTGHPALKVIGDKPIDYVVTDPAIDPVAFVDEFEIYRREGISHSVILRGMPGAGKSTFIQSVAELMRGKVLMIGTSVMDSSHFPAGSVEYLVEALQPDILLLDDIGYSDNVKVLFTALPDMRARFPRMLIATTLNDIKSIPPAILRAGRGGLLMPNFVAPSQAGRAEVLNYFLLKHMSADEVRKWFDVAGMAGGLSPYATQDWCRALVERCILWWKRAKEYEATHLTPAKMEAMREAGAVFMLTSPRAIADAYLMSAEYGYQTPRGLWGLYGMKAEKGAQRTAKKAAKDAKGSPPADKVQAFHHLMVVAQAYRFQQGLTSYWQPELYFGPEDTSVSDRELKGLRTWHPAIRVLQDIANINLQLETLGLNSNDMPNKEESKKLTKLSWAEAQAGDDTQPDPNEVADTLAAGIHIPSAVPETTDMEKAAE